MCPFLWDPSKMAGFLLGPFQTHQKETSQAKDGEFIWPRVITYASILRRTNTHVPPTFMYTRCFLGFDPQPYLLVLSPAMSLATLGVLTRTSPQLSCCRSHSTRCRHPRCPTGEWNGSQMLERKQFGGSESVDIPL